PAFVRDMDARFAFASTRRWSALAPAPMFAPLRLRGLELANRVVLAPPPLDAAIDGTIGDRYREALADAGSIGAGLILTELAAVSPEGRVTSGSPGMYEPAGQLAWASPHTVV